jgi:hypothetical protein
MGRAAGCRSLAGPFLSRAGWHTGGVEHRLDGGNAGGAVRAGNTVRKTAGPWTPAVHALLRHLAGKNFAGAPRPLGIDGRGREVLTFLDGETVGSARPWPAWTHSDDTLLQAARWMRGYHDAVADFVPPPGAVWRMGGQWRPRLIVGHNDTAPYNAVWQAGRLAGFFDWDMAGPVTREWDLAYAAFSWVPLHARHVVQEGFTDFGSRRERLRRFLSEYGWNESAEAFLAVVRARLAALVTSLRQLAVTGEPVFGQLIAQGADTDLETALAQLHEVS